MTNLPAMTYNFMRAFLFLFFFASTQTLQLKAQESSLRNLGPQIKASVIQGSTFLTDASGAAMVYTVVRGNPAHLLGFTLSDKKLQVDLPLPGSDGAWDLAVSSDGWLYIPGAKGVLYRHLPGTKQIEDLGLVLPEQTVLWNLAAGLNGEMFGATYPGCRVFRYHPSTGFTDVGKGPLVPGENYVRSLAYHKATGKLFAGVGSHADLIELDPATGNKRSILPDNLKDKEFVYSLEILEGLPDGDRLLALITAGSFTLVYNLKTGQFEYEIKEMDMKAVSSVSANGKFYYTLKSGLYSRDIRVQHDMPVRHLDDAGSANAMLAEDGHLKILNADAELLEVDLKTLNVKKAKLDVPGQPISIQSIMKGPDGRIWSGGYLAGGHAAYDPVKDVSTSYPGLHQTEGMAVKDQDIYFGIYPKGMYYRYDTSKPWDPKKFNPKFLGQIPDQSRSFAVFSEPLSNKIFFGMVPEYGKLGGHLVSYDVSTAQLKTYGAVSKDQSIVSLTYANKLLWGGTSVSGGLGVRPSTPVAKLFSWDIQKQQIVDELIPVSGANAITSLIVSPKGYIWGMAGGTLFVFDPVGKKIIKTIEVYPTRPLTSHVWRDAFLIWHPSGKVYGTGNSELFRIDPVTFQVEHLARPASLLAMDDEGRLYFQRAADLWQFIPSGS
jgi:hypothetical protein